MTAQIGDTFVYKESEYNIVAISTPLKFTPQDYGITPEPSSTACWAGFWCEYEISEDGIILKNFYVNSKDDYYPEVNGITPLAANKKSKDYFKYMGHHLYKDVNIKIPLQERLWSVKISCLNTTYTWGINRHGHMKH